MADLKVINSNIKKVAKSGAAFNALVHATAVMCIEHASEHGDANPAKNLVAAMPKTTRRTALIKWFSQYSPIAIDQKAGEFSCHLRKPDSKSYNNYNLDGANANPWYDMPELQKEEIFLTAEDFDDSVISLVNRMEKKLKDQKVLAADIPAFTAKVAALKEFAA